MYGIHPQKQNHSVSEPGIRTVKWTLTVSKIKKTIKTDKNLHFIFTVHLFIIELLVPTNAPRQFFSLFSLL
jgi:hypothetical protein